MPSITKKDLLFNCEIFEYTEADIALIIEDLNNAIHNTINGLVVIGRPADQNQMTPRPSQESRISHGHHLLKYLELHSHSGGNAAEFAAEFLIRDLVITSIHSFFFTGMFLGFGTDSRHTFLERLMTEIAATGSELVLSGPLLSHGMNEFFSSYSSS